MPNNSPFALWDPARASSLSNRIAHGLNVMPDDLIAILEGDPGCVPDPLLREMLLKDLRRKLRAPKGRRPISHVRKMLIQAAKQWVKADAQALREEIAAGKRKRTRGDDSPTKMAADAIAGWLPGNTSGRTLLNQISDQK